MYLRDLTATFATALGVPPIKVVEHHRSIRDGTEAIAGTLSPSDLERMQRMFNGKPGPTGGFDVDAFGCAFFLTAFLVDGPRHTVTSKTAAIMYATSTSRCRLTDATMFGTALAAVLRDGAINARVSSVQVTHREGGLAEIHYKHGDEGFVSRFWVNNLASCKLSRAYMIGVAPSSTLNLIHQMLVANAAAGCPDHC
jgi:hypothetical protein